MNPHWKVHPALIAVVGTLEANEIIPPKEKEKKQRAPIVRKQFNDNDSMQHDEVSASEGTTKNKAQTIAKKLDTILRHHTKKNRSEGQGTNLFEFVLDPASLHKTIEYLFYVTFLVHDGMASLHREGTIIYMTIRSIECVLHSAF
jgi:hypothetical protein